MWRLKVRVIRYKQLHFVCVVFFFFFFLGGGIDSWVRIHCTYNTAVNKYTLFWLRVYATVTLRLGFFLFHIIALRHSSWEIILIYIS